MAKNIIEKPPFVFENESLSDKLFDIKYIIRFT